MSDTKSIGSIYANNFNYGLRYAGGMGLGLNDKIESGTHSLLANTVGDIPVLSHVADATVGMGGVALARTVGYATSLVSHAGVPLFGLTLGPLLGFEVGTSELSARANGYALTTGGDVAPPPPPGSGY